MRIGNTIIDTDAMTLEEIDSLIGDLHAIRCRKQMKESIESRLTKIYNLMRQEGFALVSPEYSEIFNPDKYVLCDMK